MVRDGLFYGLALIVVAIIVWFSTHILALTLIPVLLAAFFLWFFRDPARTIPQGAGVIVSPADGKVEEADWIETTSGSRVRVTIFLNVFDVHVNRVPSEGVVSLVEYREGHFLNALKPESAVHNEQTLVTIENELYTISFKQIAGLLARRIVCNLQPGQRVERGQRMGMIKFGSRCDVLLPAKCGPARQSRRPSEGRKLRARHRSHRRADGRTRMSAEPAKLHPIRHGMYVLPSLFTAGNIAMGYYAILQSIRGIHTNTSACFDHAAIAIVLAGLFDGLDGRIARLTNTSSAFGRELDSLADVITFGVAPSLLAYLWGVRQVVPSGYPIIENRVEHFGAVICFLFLICGACRLARFNISIDPKPRNPGRPGRKYFVGMPIPAGAAVVSAVIHFEGGSPVHNVWLSALWIALVAFTGFLMVSSWRFWSGKEIDFSSRRPGRLLVLVLVFLAVIFEWHQYALIALAMIYLVSGVAARLAYSWTRGSAKAS